MNWRLTITHCNYINIIMSVILSFFYGRYLHVTGDQFGRPIHGQREVSGYSYPELGNEWKTMV